MTLGFTTMFANKVHLDICNVWTPSQVVVSHQTVEVERPGRTDIDLIVGYFIDTLQKLAHL